MRPHTHLSSFDLEQLKKDFVAYRTSDLKTKRYPLPLKKRAVAMLTRYRAKYVAETLLISPMTLSSWKKKLSSDEHVSPLKPLTIVSESSDESSPEACATLVLKGLKIQIPLEHLDLDMIEKLTGRPS